MTTKFYKTKEFAKLDKQWRKKLEKAGFTDLEQNDRDLILKSSSSQFSRQKFLDTAEFKQEYYYRATHFLNDYTFESKLEQTIWEYHAEGISYRNIAKTLTKVNIKMNKNDVWIIVKKLEDEMHRLYKEQNEA